MVDSSLFHHREVSREGARISFDPARRGDPVDERLFGKFCEHLGRNIANGMHAQVLCNPTFGSWEFPVDDAHPDGGIRPGSDTASVRTAVQDYCKRWDLPDPDARFEAYRNGAAFGWVPTDSSIRTTPDVTPEGDRAQRIVLSDSDGGLLQRTHFPFHRTDRYELTCRLRATKPTSVTVGIYEPGSDPITTDPLAATTCDADRNWATIEEELTVRAAAADDAAYTVAITARGCDVVVDRLTIYPADHINKADPEVVAYLREVDLPLLRWPGGNFVSGYRWRDGVGPIDERPSRVNPAWGHVESNLFGTAEFISFCETVGCEPMICVNAGDGTPAEAARWVEYCNGSTDTEMGALRAEHGFREPFDVRYWEIGNELFGRWQVGWTTPSGNADRYRQFREAILRVDPDAGVQACGNRNSPHDRWNGRLLEEARDEVRTITDHILTGGRVDAGTDPDELFCACMGYAKQLGDQYRNLRDEMRGVGIDEPRLAITELQLFADFVTNREIEHHGSPFTADRMPARTTVSEPLYLATIVHECIRLGSFVEMLTHSATVNHGGGLQKKRERTWPDPAHYGHQLLAALGGGTPIGIDVRCDVTHTEHSFGDIRAIDAMTVIDAVAVEQNDSVVLTVVNRSRGDKPVGLTVDVSAIAAGETATLTTLSADEMDAENTYDEPNRVSPESSTASVRDGEIAITIPSYSLTRLNI
ncbi:alpha-L-arabinofuranosidase C-terminal domain-containing protein (plasmid) [Haloferacaceae archaeon DSL9]